MEEATASAAPEVQQHGPGTELKTMLASVGIQPGANCPCREMMRKMNRWGVAGCREHRGEIVMHIQQQMQGRSWRDKLAAAAKAAANGLAFQLDPRDIPGSLVDEAIRRAE